MNLIPLSVRSSTKLLSFARRKCDLGKYGEARKAVDLVVERLSAVKTVSSETLSRAWEVWLLKGHIHKNLGENNLATVAFLFAYEILPLDNDAIEFLATELLQDGDLSDRARSIYLEYLATDYSTVSRRSKKNLQLLEALSAPRWRQDEPLKKTIEWNRQILKRRPDLAWPHRHIGTIALGLADWYIAVDSLQQAYKLDHGKWETTQSLAYALFRVGRFHDAKNYLDRLLSVQASNAALLLRAHVHRSLKSFVAAARDFRKVAEMNALTDEERLSYAEVCVNAGYFEEAAKELEDLQWFFDGRWLLLSAIVDEAGQRYDQALARLDQVIFTDEQLADQAVLRMLNLLASHPELPDALTVLEELPYQYHDDSYRIIKGNILLKCGRTQQALETWGEVTYPDEELYAAISALEHYHLATLYNQNRDLEILRLLRNGLIVHTDSDDLAEIIMSSLTRYIHKNLNATARPKKFRKYIALIETYFPRSADFDRLDLLRALVHMACKEYDEAAEIFSELAPNTNPCLNLQIARCAIHTGAWSDCLEALNYVDRQNPQAQRIRCALSALNGDWDDALDHLSGLQNQTDLDKFKAAILFKAGKSSELQSLNGNAVHVANYYRIAHLLNTGNDEPASQLRNSIPANDPHRVLSNRLFGWRRLQTAKQFRATDGHPRRAENLLAALILWPDSHGPASCVKNPDADFMRTLLLTETGSEAFGAVLEHDARSRGPANPASCHNLGLFHFCRGVRKAAEDDFEHAFESWQRAIAYLSIALADENYMVQWIRSRLQTYGIDQPVEPRRIIDQVVRSCDDTFKKTSEELANSGKPTDSALFADLLLALRAEFMGAREVNSLGGFETPADIATRISPGPMFVSMLNYEPTFSVFLANLKMKYSELPENLPEDPVAAVWAILDKWEADEMEGAADPSVKERVEKLYSAARFAFVRQEEGNFEAALRRLREARTNFGRSRRQVNLAERNPAFARRHGRKDFLNLVDRYEVELLTALGEHDVASSDHRIDSGVQYWREALSLARVFAEDEWVAQKVRDVAVGRAQYLQSKDQGDEAITLLEEVNRLCGDELVNLTLSKLLAVRGVRANNAGDGPQAVQDLRYAVSLNPHSVYAQYNFSIVLRNQLEDLQYVDPDQAVSLLEEALAAVNKCIEIDPDKEEYWDAQLSIKDDLTWLRSVWAT